MALTVTASNTCEQINIVADYYSATTSAILTFGAFNASGVSILSLNHELATSESILLDLPFGNGPACFLDAKVITSPTKSLNVSMSSFAISAASEINNFFTSV